MSKEKWEELGSPKETGINVIAAAMAIDAAIVDGVLNLGPVVHKWQVDDVDLMITGDLTLKEKMALALLRSLDKTQRVSALAMSERLY
jgi:hypothetical protein